MSLGLSIRRHHHLMKKGGHSQTVMHVNFSGLGTEPFQTSPCCLPGEPLGDGHHLQVRHHLDERNAAQALGQAKAGRDLWEGSVPAGVQQQAVGIDRAGRREDLRNKAPLGLSTGDLHLLEHHHAVARPGQGVGGGLQVGDRRAGARDTVSHLTQACVFNGNYSIDSVAEFKELPYAD